jgi:hypothetical protein
MQTVVNLIFGGICFVFNMCALAFLFLMIQEMFRD